MRKLIFILAMALLVAILPATITYSTVTSKTLNTFGVYSGSTTVAVGDTVAGSVPYILSPTFTIGDKMSNRGIMISGVVNTAILYSATPVSFLKCVLQVSANGSTFADFASYDAYMCTGATAGVVAMIPASLSGVHSPYYRVKWVGYSAAGTALVADIYGKITTSITVPGSP